jgi:hypothetical protein
MPLLTEFRATVDGTSGDTYLEHIDAKLGGSQFTCSGAVVNIKGRGHAIHVTADVEQGNIGDFLQLAIKTLPPAMSGLISLTTSLDIDPGGESVTRKLNMKGEFSLREIHFTDAEVEDKVDILSLRARGETDNLKSGAPDVQSRLVADFSMRRGELTFPHLEYWLPGGDVKLSGTYRLEGRICDFAGDVRTKAEVSNMIASKWRSILLKPIDPFFRKHGWGAVIPVHVSGRNGKVKVGLRF